MKGIIIGGLAGFILMITTTVNGQINSPPTDCSYYNTTNGPTEYANSDATHHVNGEHYWTNTKSGTCTYTGSAQASASVQCGITATSNSQAFGHDNGDLDTLLDKHEVNWATQNGTATASNGASATAYSEGAVAVQECLISCSTAITISGSGTLGWGVAFNPTPLWKDADPYPNSCGSVSLPPIASSCAPSTGPPTQSTQNGYWEWSTGSCSWVWVYCASVTENCGPGGSPIVIDTLKKGFVFTDPTIGDYVTFDLKGDGTYGHYSWPKVGSGNAWLVLDDGTGIVKDGKQLFGNFTPHSDGDVPNRDSRDKNGFLALAWYDKRAQGGNTDGIIDRQDAIWPHLKLWIDEHCYLKPANSCESLPSELHTLESEGVYALSLIYGYSPGKVDAIGNHYRFYSVVNPSLASQPIGANGHHVGGDRDLTHSKDGRLTYDVWLKQIQ